MSFPLLSLRRPSVFFLLLLGLSLFSIGAWWSVHSAVEANIRSRLALQTDQIELKIQSKITAYADALSALQGNLALHPNESPAEFRNYLSKLNFSKRFPNVLSVGFLEAASAPAQSQSQSQSETTASTLAQLSPRSKLKLIEMQQRYSVDLGEQSPLGSPVQRDAILKKALASPQSTNKPALHTLMVLPDGASSVFALTLPVYSKSVDAEPGDRTLKGVVFLELKANDLMTEVFGFPSLSREQVNFIVSSNNSGTNGVLYNRFDLQDIRRVSEFKIERLLKIDGQIDSQIDSQTNEQIYGQIDGQNHEPSHLLRLTVTPLESFFSVWEDLLSTAIGFGAVFISVLILLILKSSQNQLLYELKAREISVLAANRSREQIEALKSLNEFAQSTSVGEDSTMFIERLFLTLNRVVRSHVAMVYFIEDHANSETPLMILREHKGIEADDIVHKSFSISDAAAFMPNQILTQKSERDSARAASHFSKNYPEFSDWILTSLSSQEFGRCGLIFIARTDRTVFHEMELELLEGLVTQSSGAIESARLFRRAEDASLAKNAFLANMSHEIRTPLNAIIGFSEMLLKHDCPDLQRDTLAENIRRGSRQLTELIEDILDISKIEAGKLRIELRRVGLATVLQDLKSVMEMRALEKKVEFRIQGLGPLPTHIMIDDIRLKQVLINVVGNAIKFTENGSVTLVVRASNESSFKTSLTFTVKDTGVGISNEAQTNLFQPFSQGDSSTTRRFGGSGLGLALSRRLCRELGGDLNLLESAPNHGSTFEVKVKTNQLPEVLWTESTIDYDEPLLQNSDEKTVNISLAGVSILVVEDSPDNQDIFRFFLESAGATVEIVDNGLDAVRRAAGADYNLILMDIQIPEIDGKEATRRIRHQGYVKPIVALTAHAMEEERASCIEAGCSGQITKPVSGDLLISEVARYLKGSHEFVSNDPRFIETAVH